MSKTSDVMPMVQSILDSEWKRILRPVLMKRIGLMVVEIEAMGDETPAKPPIDLAAIREAYRAGFIEACKWPSPVMQDVESTDFDRQFRKWNNEVRAIGGTP